MVLKKLTLVLFYSRDFLTFSIIITLLTYSIYYTIGNTSLTAIFWFKLITILGGISIHQRRKSKELFFYMNNGLGKRELMISSAILDLGIWLFGIILMIKTVN
jgi:hypothetical protein